ncbi:hypothetical protein AMTRI_Chr07g77020 [Amborella trichopoda]
MQRVAINHFKKAFTKEVTLLPSFNIAPFKVLLVESKNFLERDISMEELRKAVFAMLGDKASGLDGDFLSSFLFTIYAECFSLMLSNVERVRHFSGFPISNSSMVVSHLQYEDDALIFCDADPLYIKNIVLFLEICEVTIGFKVNFHKSSLVDINCTESLTESLATLMGNNVGSFPFLSLGLQIFDSRLSLAVWDRVLETVQCKLDLWKPKYLSLGGRVTLLRSCLANLLVY